MAHQPLTFIRTLCLLTALILPCLAPGRGASEDSIPPGTTVTTQNWRQYKQFMPDGMQALFAGTYFWKMPADLRMEVEPTGHYPLPPT